MHLNCYQISPAMSQMLNYTNMSLPHKKKIIRYTFEKPETGSMFLLEQLKSQSNIQPKSKITSSTFIL